MSDQGKGMSDLWKRLRFVFVAIVVYRIGNRVLLAVPARRTLDA